MVGDERGEVVGQGAEQSGLLGERFDVRDRLGDHDHLPVMRAGALQDRDPAAGGHVDHGPELVEHQRPRRVGLPGGGVDVGDRQDGDRGRFVGHVVGVGAPHHDGA